MGTKSPSRPFFFLILGAFALSPFSPHILNAESFSMKTGAWEITSTPQASGPLVPPDVLAKMPPEQLAKLEQMRAAKPIPLTTQECVTKEDLDQNRILKGDSDADKASQCIIKVVTKSSNKLVYERTCTSPKPSTEQVAIEAPSSESLIGSIDRTSGRNKLHVDMKGRWLGASCAGIKE